MAGPQTIRVTLDGARDYDIRIASGILSRAGAIIERDFGENKRVFVICDPNIAKHRATLDSSLMAAGHAATFFDLPEGEGAKTWDALGKTVNWLLEKKADRKSLVIAVGGGVTGDHAGFAAAIALRGIDFIQIPTTLLAQVDSSVGGKTGINAPQGKNMIGAFHQPRLVLIDPSVLVTLDDRQMRAGYAEVVKHAFIRDAAFFDWLQNTNVLTRGVDVLSEAIARSCQIKADIVAADEKEAGDRALLNFGHTFAHALETACNYDRRLLHGEAVSIGMCLAFELSARLGHCPRSDADKAIKHLKDLDLPTRIADVDGFPQRSADALIDLMSHDKKAEGGTLRFIVSKGIGSAFISKDVDINTIRSVIEASL
ncbi:MAG TPA: 3-dehydroquinate synthase [Alphaproteobacteria bacterium]